MFEAGSGKLYEGTLSDFWPGFYRNVASRKRDRAFGTAANVQSVEWHRMACERPGGGQRHGPSGTRSETTSSAFARQPRCTIAFERGPLLALKPA